MNLSKNQAKNQSKNQSLVRISSINQELIENDDEDESKEKSEFLLKELQNEKQESESKNQNSNDKENEKKECRKKLIDVEMINSTMMQKDAQENIIDSWLINDYSSINQWLIDCCDFQDDSKERYLSNILSVDR